MTSIPKEPVMLLSYINMKLRDEGRNLDALCEDLGVGKTEIIEKLQSIDYTYDEETNQFN